MRKTYRFAWVFLLLLLLILSSRLIWVVSQTESGWTLLKQQWLEATVGRIEKTHLPVHEMDPTDQADFWLAEAKRITSENPNNAELAMGAAIVLDSPSMEFRSHYSKFSLSLIYGICMGEDTNKVWRERDEFETKCRKDCMALAAKAVELQPDDPRWRELSALFLIPEDSFTDRNNPPRNPDWLKILEKCKNHDPKNAIYDYLASEIFWVNSVKTEYDPQSKNNKLEITDQEKYAQALDYFQNGQKLDYCAISDDCSNALLSFLSRAKISCSERENAAIFRSFYYRLFYLMTVLGENLESRAEKAKQNDDMTARWNIAIEMRRIVEQFCSHTATWNYSVTTADLKLTALKELNLIAEIKSEPVDPEELSQIQDDLKNAEIDTIILQKAYQRIYNLRTPPSPIYVALTLSFVVIAISSILPLLMGGICSLLIGIILNRRKPPLPTILGFIRQAIIWAAVYALTFVALGMTAAKIIPPQVQGWIMLALLVLPILASSYWLFWLFIKYDKRQYALYALLVFVILVAVCCWIYTLLAWDISNIGHIVIPERTLPWDWQWLTQETWPNVFRSDLVHIWMLALWEWVSYKGPYISIALAAAAIALWFNLRFKRITSKNKTQSYSRWGGTFYCLGHSMIAVSFLWIIVYLCIMPYMVQLSESDYQYKMSYIRDPDKSIHEIKAAIAEVRADKNWMDMIQSEKPQE